MKVKFHLNADISKDDLNVIIKFVRFLNTELKLPKDVRIDLVDKKTKEMTTGVREEKHHIKVLCKHRMLIDILRTIAHEWVHEFQHQKLGVKDTDKLPQIGGWGENMANAVSGILVKQFNKIHKELEDEIY
jgi:hypothetical protein